ncbi:MAG: IS110 family transposase, partial [Nitrospirae bacterium]
WIPPGEIRDKRELLRARMALRRHCTAIKNRIHAMLDRYGLGMELEDYSDIFTNKGRAGISAVMKQLRGNARKAMEDWLEALDFIEAKIEAYDKMILKEFEEDEQVRLLKTIPGIGKILAPIIRWEVGDIKRFKGPEQYVSYSGCVPKVKASGGKVRYGRMVKECNQTLKWAYIEAANAVVLNIEKYPWRHVTRLYLRVKSRKGSQKAKGAVGRHLAVATWAVLTYGEEYKEPKVKRANKGA